MPVTLKLINFDTIYNRIKSPKILINHEDVFNTENKETGEASATFFLKAYSIRAGSNSRAAERSDSVGTKQITKSGELSSPSQ